MMSGGVAPDVIGSTAQTATQVARPNVSHTTVFIQAHRRSRGRGAKSHRRAAQC
jgi:hypothetical protein